MILSVVENGFVRIPETAPWLAEYLHEMTVFPKGKHDEQLGATAQFLDWFKHPSGDHAYFEYMRMRVERRQTPENPEYLRVHLRAPYDVGSVQTFSGRHLTVGPDRTVEMSTEDAEYLIDTGWTKLAEWTSDDRC